MNTLWLERLTEESILQHLSKDDLILKLKTECGLDCPPHFKKKFYIQAILEAKYGEENKQQRGSNSERSE